MSLELKVRNTGIEGMEYVSVFNLGMHLIVKDVLVITYLLWQLFLYVLYLLLFLMRLS